MSPGDLLQLIVEASLGLAGFAGVVNALAGRGARSLSRLHQMNLVNLLATAFGALFLSLAALAMMVAGIEERTIWRTLSTAGLIVTVYFAIRSVQAIVAEIGTRAAATSGSVLAIDGPLLILCALQIWNTAVLGAFWPFFLLLIALFAIGCFSFTRLLLAPAVEQ